MKSRRFGVPFSVRSAVQNVDGSEGMIMYLAERASHANPS